MNRWVKMAGETVTAGPGPLPTYLNDEAGNPVRASLLSEEEINSCGWFKVAQVRPAFDRRFQLETGPEFSVVGGVPTDTFTVSFRPNARDYMIAAIDQQAEWERRIYLTALPAQMDEYALAIEEARLASDDYDNGIAPVEGQYPYLEADLNVTINPQTGEAVTTVYEAALVVLGMASQYRAIGAQIRRSRLKAKADVRAAASDAAALAVVHAFSPSVVRMFVLEPNSTHPFDEFNEVWNPGLVPVEEE